MIKHKVKKNSFAISWGMCKKPAVVNPGKQKFSLLLLGFWVIEAQMDITFIFYTLKGKNKPETLAQIPPYMFPRPTGPRGDHGSIVAVMDIISKKLGLWWDIIVGWAHFWKWKRNMWSTVKWLLNHILSPATTTSLTRRQTSSVCLLTAPSRACSATCSQSPSGVRRGTRLRCARGDLRCRSFP